MSRIVFVTWSGGGNLLPALGIGRELDRRGHSIAFLGEETQRDAIEANLLPFTSYHNRTGQGGAPQAAPGRRSR